MAHVEPSTPQAVPPPAETPVEQKRGRGRPPKQSATPAAAEPGYTAPKYPPPPSRVLGPEQFFTYWNGIPEAERARFLVYVYRHKPVIRKPKPTHIAKYPTPVPMEHIVRRHGAGRYGLTLTDLAKSRGGEVCECRLKFDEAEYPWDQFPPDCEPSELVMDDPDNQPYIRWLKARGLLNMSPQGNDTTSAAAVQAMAHTVNKLLESVVNKKPDADASFTRLMEMFTAGNKAALDMALSQVKANSPEETLKLITTMQAAFSRPEAGPDPRMTMLTDELKAMRQDLSAEREANRKLMEKLVDAKSAPPAKSEESELTKGVMGRLIERALDSLDGGSSRGPRRSMLAEVLDTAGPQISEALGTLKVWGSALGAYWGSRAPQTFTPQAPAPPSIPQGIPAPPPPGSAAPNPPAPAAPDAQPQQPAQADNEEEGMRQMVMAFLDRNWPTIQKFINDGTPGQAFADYLMEGGALNAPMLRMIVEIGPDRIMEIIRATPPAWQAVQPIEPMFREFLIEFLAWTPGWDGEEDDPPPGPRVVPPPPGKGVA